MSLLPLSERLSDRTKLFIGRDPGRRWWWAVVRPDGTYLDANLAPSWSEALAVGLAALEAVSVERMSA